MKLLTAEIRKKLLRNGRLHQQCDEAGKPEPDFAPVVKLFTPDAGCTWLLTEIDPDNPGYRLWPVRPRHGLSGIRFRQPVGTGRLTRQAELPVERDLYFTATKTLSAYADEARAHGAIKA